MVYVTFCNLSRKSALPMYCAAVSIITGARSFSLTSMLGAVLAYTVAQYIPGPAALGWFAALVIAPVIVAAIAAAADTLVLKRLNYDPEATIVATIGLLYILEQAALSFFGPEFDAHKPPWAGCPARWRRCVGRRVSLPG